MNSSKVIPRYKSSNAFFFFLSLLQRCSNYNYQQSTHLWSPASVVGSLFVVNACTAQCLELAAISQPRKCPRWLGVCACERVIVSQTGKVCLGLCFAAWSTLLISKGEISSHWMKAHTSSYGLAKAVLATGMFGSFLLIALHISLLLFQLELLLYFPS